eukprot:comp24104_c1_seq1/m.43557 comp24104_c1_seq1/g.43557  ORF comp24104_c1_seq1/g.43557 comp24104_c1_seq1/m.43557 type:complete len:107 (+) comp24104_c1_seq1:516-836(+)
MHFVGMPVKDVHRACAWGMQHAVPASHMSGFQGRARFQGVVRKMKGEMQIGRGIVGVGTVVDIWVCRGEAGSVPLLLHNWLQFLRPFVVREDQRRRAVAMQGGATS